MQTSRAGGYGKIDKVLVPLDFANTETTLRESCHDAHQSNLRCCPASDECGLSPQPTTILRAGPFMLAVNTNISRRALRRPTLTLNLRAPVDSKNGHTTHINGLPPHTTRDLPLPSRTSFPSPETSPLLMSLKSTPTSCPISWVSSPPATERLPSQHGFLEYHTPQSMCMERSFEDNVEKVRFSTAELIPSHFPAYDEKQNGYCPPSHPSLATAKCETAPSGRRSLLPQATCPAGDSGSHPRLCF
ncbi:hypothetical protein CC80DRAFT_507690 [Byssothecium circinans]|uniref:Uncharacterized protein n=1 Tax=Byssothecium circinans TaxID=147558 RepID=A0A6A5TQ75_9PLEO|nr:hypothetical protein CC80DRAFT_507690 [Byssothecium circinans]